MRLDGELKELTLTTNGPQLACFAQDLADCGVRRINGLLDTLDAIKFQKITRRGDLARVMQGINAALEAGLKIKLNAVAVRPPTSIGSAPWRSGEAQAPDFRRHTALAMQRDNAPKTCQPQRNHSCAAPLVESSNWSYMT